MATGTRFERAIKKYNEVNLKMEVLENSKKLLAEEILVELGARKLKKFVVEAVGTFSVVGRKVWKYSPAVKGEEVILKTMKKAEEESGVAKAEEINSLRFTTK